MSSGLEKTVASLETALQYNPDNLELLTSLAEGYIRMGRLDEKTIDLCDKVLDRRPESALIGQAQVVSFVIEQTDQIQAGLSEEKEPPPTEDIQSSLAILDEFIQEVHDAPYVWFTWTRLSLLSGLVEQATAGIAKLKELEFAQVAELRPCLDWASTNIQKDRIPWRLIFQAYAEIGATEVGFRRLEEKFDLDAGQSEIGPILLAGYRKFYHPSRPDEVPEELRPRFFQVLLDYGDPEETASWLRQAALFGWEINSYTKVYIKELIGEGDVETAFELIQRMQMDSEVQAWLNQIAEIHEDRDEVEEAVKVLKFINGNLLNESEEPESADTEMTREMELSLAELNVKNGRLNEALVKYTTALCLSESPDPDIVERIDDILTRTDALDAPLLLRLAAYFKRHRDHPKTVFYINQVLAQNPDNIDALTIMQELFVDILADSPDNPDLRLELGKLYLRLDKVEDAITELEIAMNASQMDGHAGHLLASAYQKAGKKQKALNQYKEVAIELDDLEDLYQLHLEFERDEDNQSAVFALDLISRLDPTYRDVASRRSGLTRQNVQENFTPPQLTPGDQRMRELIGDLATGRYRHIEKVGSGGMGVVHKVEDLRISKVVAMKILRDGLGGTSKALDRFFREARIAASIDNRNIVEIFDYNISSMSGQSYICMEFVDGPSMREMLDKQFEDTVSVGKEYMAEIVYYSVQLLSALEATHTKGIIHRDIKPDNIMITQHGEVKITDFGIVHVEEATFTPSGAMLGTPRYMSPEQVTGAGLDGRSDIYSLGILLYEMLTGSPPFITGDIAYQHVNKEPVEPGAINKSVPSSINQFILKCLEKDPDDRFTSSTEAKEVLLTALDEMGGCAKFQKMTVAGTGCEDEGGFVPGSQSMAQVAEPAPGHSPGHSPDHASDQAPAAAPAPRDDDLDFGPPPGRPLPPSNSAEPSPPEADHLDPDLDFG